MTTVPPATLAERLRWRYATKRFDPSRTIPEDVWAALEEALVLTPSSFGMQPWRFIVVTDPSVRQRLSGASFGQRQPAECSHFVVFARRSGLPVSDIDRHLKRVVELTGVAPERLGRYRAAAVAFRDRAAAEGWLDAWADRQVYIALGNFMTAAAVMGIDTCPMEGIEAPAYDALTGLEGSGYTTIVACAAGYRAPDDPAATRRKIRFAVDDVIGRV